MTMVILTFSHGAATIGLCIPYALMFYAGAVVSIPYYSSNAVLIASQQLRVIKYTSVADLVVRVVLLSILNTARLTTAGLIMVIIAGILVKLGYNMYFLKKSMGSQTPDSGCLGSNG